MHRMTFTADALGWQRVTSPAIPGQTITLAPPLEDEPWISTVRGDDGRCLTGDSMVDLARRSIETLLARQGVSA